jgi:dCMP deaminase
MHRDELRGLKEVSTRPQAGVHVLPFTVPVVPLEEIDRPSWDEYFLDIAMAVATRADCTRRKVGAVVVKDRRIRATGYNGAPAGEPGCISCPRRVSTVAPGSSYDTGAGACVAVHAEANALLYCDREDLIGATLYLTTDPCEGCQKLIRATGVVRVVWPEGELNYAG